MQQHITIRTASVGDLGILVPMNQQLIADERHRNAMSERELHDRMAQWISAGEYNAYLFEVPEKVVGYCLCKNTAEHIYLRQFFISRELRRQGYGRAALKQLFDNKWKGRRVRVDVLSLNTKALAFWRRCGFGDYAVILEKQELDKSLLQMAETD